MAEEPLQAAGAGLVPWWLPRAKRRSSLAWPTLSTEVITRYQKQATISIGNVVKSRAPMAWATPNISVPPITATREVVLSIVISSLPVGGTMTRMAWGSTMRRIVWLPVRPRACAASVWPWSTERMPPRTISAMYAASLSDSARSAAPKVLITELVSTLNEPRPRVGKIRARLNQMTTWTRIGVPRNSQR